LIFNIEAATEDTYDKIMGTAGCFNIMKQSVAAANKCGLTTEAHFVPMRLNIGEIEKVIELCHNLGISKISFLRFVLHGRALSNEETLALDDIKLIHLRKFLHDLRPRGDIQIRIGVPLSSNIDCHKCEAANGKLNIKYNGYVYPCEVFKNERVSKHLNGYMPESIYGKSLKEIYHNSACLEYVRKASQTYAKEQHHESCIGQYLIAKENI
jgi:MoaA/NifB/PqqE/SkfB family radical SAM enzyme